MFLLFCAVLLVSLAGAGAVTATEYHCFSGADQSITDRCSITEKADSTMSVFCMKSAILWNCDSRTQTCVNNQASEKVRMPRHPVALCPTLCGPCDGMWKEYRSGGATF